MAKKKWKAYDKKRYTLEQAESLCKELRATKQYQEVLPKARYEEIGFIGNRDWERYYMVFYLEKPQIQNPPKLKRGAVMALYRFEYQDWCSYRVEFDHLPTIDELWPIIKDAEFNGKKKNYQVRIDENGIASLWTNLSCGDLCDWRQTDCFYKIPEKAGV